MKTIIVRACSGGNVLEHATGRVMPTDENSLDAARRAALRLYRGAHGVTWRSDGIDVERDGKVIAAHFRGTVYARSVRGGGRPILGEVRCVVPNTEAWYQFNPRAYLARFAME
jgi:hypothetical protein